MFGENITLFKLQVCRKKLIFNTNYHKHLHKNTFKVSYKDKGV